MAKKNNSDGMGSIIIRDVNEGLRKQFRMLCLEKEISMNQAVKDYVAWAVKNKKLVPGGSPPGLARVEAVRDKT